MKRPQFARMRHAAQHLLELQAQGIEVDPLSIEWARFVVASNRPPKPLAFQQDKIIAALRGHPPEGLLAVEIREAAGLTRKVCAVTLSYMARHDQIAMLKIPGRSRFFADAAALERGRPLVERMESDLAAVKHAAEQKRAARAENRPVAKPVPKPAPRPAIVATKAAPKVPRGQGSMAFGPGRDQGVISPEMLPPGVCIKTLPAGRDTRFEPQPPIEGIGSVREWKQLRRQKRRDAR